MVGPLSRVWHLSCNRLRRYAYLKLHDSAENDPQHNGDVFENGVKSEAYQHITREAWLQHNKTLKIQFATVILVFLIGVSVLLVVFGMGDRPNPLPKLLDWHRKMPCTTWPSGVPSMNTTTKASSVQPKRPKPSGFKIVGLVFFGRREFVDVLDCYLRQNLVSNGGYLDEVQFLDNARERKDGQWLDKLVKSVDEYRKVEVPTRCETSIAWTGCLWDTASDRDTLYIKVDDDILYMNEDAIPSLVATRLKHKEAFAIGANMVNVHATVWSHYHNNAIHPYLPDPDTTNIGNAKRSWRTSEDPLIDGNDLRIATFNQVAAMKAPSHGHRWLRVNGTGEVLLRTPIGIVEHLAEEPDIHSSWAILAQLQYSLLENLEKNQLGRYHVGDEDGIWNLQYQRYNINFLAVWGADIADHLPFDIQQTFAVDEQLLNIDLPLKTGRPFLVDSHAIAMHYAFRPQLDVTKTDLLDRWRAYANEMVCDRPRKPFGPVCHTSATPEIRTP